MDTVHECSCVWPLSCDLRGQGVFSLSDAIEM